MREAVIVAAVRTAVGTFGGALSSVPAVSLGKTVIQAVLARAGVEARQVDQVIMGNVLQAGLGQNPARQAAVRAGLPEEVPAYSINMVCGSGLKSINFGVQAIQTGDADIVLAGGMENMSQAPYLAPKARWGGRMGHTLMEDSMIKDGLWCAFNDVHMGVTAENVARRYGISREEQDRFACESQAKAAAARASGRFNDEIVPVVIKDKKQETIFAADEHIRETSSEKLAALKPAFLEGGTVTAGNASGINDGAAAVLLMAAGKAEALGIKPLAVVRGTAEVGVDPAVMGIGPVPATRKALSKAGLAIADLQLVEANEAFASQALAVMRELELPAASTNVNGGAIALGHPIGASGARILVTLLYEMQKRQARCGLATLCVGGGQGVATIVERVG